MRCTLRCLATILVPTFQVFIVYFSISNLISFIVFLTRLVSITKAGQDLINAMAESKLQLGLVLTTVKPSLYFDGDDGGGGCQDGRILFRNKLTLLHHQLDNKSPISPFSGTQGGRGPGFHLCSLSDAVSLTTWLLRPHL